MGNSCAAGERESKLKETTLDYEKGSSTFSQSPIEYIDIIPISCMAVDASTQIEPGWMKISSDTHLSVTIVDILPKEIIRTSTFRVLHASRLLQLNSTSDQETPAAQSDSKPLKRRNAFRFHKEQFGILSEWCCDAAMQTFQITQSSDLISSLLQPYSAICEFEVSLEQASMTVILKEWTVQPHQLESVQILHSPLLRRTAKISTRNRNINHRELWSIRQKPSFNILNNQSKFHTSKWIRAVEKDLLIECERLNSEVGRLEVLAAIRSNINRLLVEGSGTKLNSEEFYCNGTTPSCDEFEVNRNHVEINRELCLSGERIRERETEELIDTEAGFYEFERCHPVC